MSPETFKSLPNETVLYRYHHLSGLSTSTRKEIDFASRWAEELNAWYRCEHTAKLYHYLSIIKQVDEEISEDQKSLEELEVEISEIHKNLKKLKSIKKDIDYYALLYPEEFL
jgi:chromosome segregation ATPase